MTQPSQIKPLSLSSSHSNSHPTFSNQPIGNDPPLLHNPPRRNRMVPGRASHRNNRPPSNSQRREADQSNGQSTRGRRPTNRSQEASSRVRHESHPTPSPCTDYWALHPKTTESTIADRSNPDIATFPPAPAHSAPSNSSRSDVGSDFPGTRRANPSKTSLSGRRRGSRLRKRFASGIMGIMRG